MESQRVRPILVTKHRTGNCDSWGSGWARQWGRNTGKRWKSVKQSIYLWADHPGKGSWNPPLTSGIREPFLTWLKAVTPKVRKAVVVSHRLPFLIIPGDINSLKLWAHACLWSYPRFFGQRRHSSRDTGAETEGPANTRTTHITECKVQIPNHDHFSHLGTVRPPALGTDSVSYPIRTCSLFLSFSCLRYERHSNPRTCQVWNKSFQDPLIHLGSFYRASLWTRNSSVAGDTTVKKKKKVYIGKDSCHMELIFC